MYWNDLNRAALAVNFASMLIGIVAYAIVAPPVATAVTILLTLAAFAAAYAGSCWVSSRCRTPGAGRQDGGTTIPTSVALPVLVILPALCAYEVISLIWLNASPFSVSWPHFAAATTLAYNVEQFFEQR